MGDAIPNLLDRARTEWKSDPTAHLARPERRVTTSLPDGSHRSEQSDGLVWALAKVLDKGAAVDGKRWLVRYREPGGRGARQREKPFDRKRDAVDFATKVENDKRENTYIDPVAGKVALRRYVDDWLAGLLLSAGTWESYERIMRLHVVPHIGSKTISQVTAADIEALYARWVKEGSKPNTVESRSIALSALFSHAVRHKRISSNPVKDAEKLENAVIPVDERSLPSLEEIHAIARTIGPRLEPAVWLMACCGLRIGESLGVFPDDFRSGTLRLRRQIVRYQGSDRQYVARYAPLKHRKEGEWRDVPVPENIYSLSSQLPVLNQAGGMTYPGLVRKSWDRAIERLGLPGYTPHDLRHKWATVTLTNGVSIHEVSRWLGHRSIKVTVDRYGHLTTDGRERCRQVVETTFGNYLPSELSSAPTGGSPARAERGAELVLG